MTPSDSIQNNNSVTLDSLSPQSKALWAKVSDEPGNVSWLPLAIHMSDACEMS